MIDKVTIGDATLYHGDCMEILPTLGKVDAVVTSPPYAEQRSAYNSIRAEIYPEWGAELFEKMFSCMRESGSVFFNIKENVKDGVRDTYALELLLSISKMYNYADEYIWVKTNPFPTGAKNRLKDAFERIWHITNGKSYKFYPDRLAAKSVSIYALDSHRRANKGEHSTTNGSGMNMSKRVDVDAVRPSNVITFPTSSLNIGHPATFPVDLPDFFIQLSTDTGDCVLDPFMGSGTSGLSCANLGRKFIGIEIERKYFDIACERIEAAYAQGRLEL